MKLVVDAPAVLHWLLQRSDDAEPLCHGGALLGGEYWALDLQIRSFVRQLCYSHSEGVKASRSLPTEEALRVRLRFLADASPLTAPGSERKLDEWRERAETRRINAARLKEHCSAPPPSAPDQEVVMMASLCLRAGEADVSQAAGGGARLVLPTAAEVAEVTAPEKAKRDNPTSPLRAGVPPFPRSPCPSRLPSLLQPPPPLCIPKCQCLHCPPLPAPISLIPLLLGCPQVIESSCTSTRRLSPSFTFFPLARPFMLPPPIFLWALSPALQFCPQGLAVCPLPQPTASQCPSPPLPRPLPASLDSHPLPIDSCLAPVVSLLATLLSGPASMSSLPVLPVLPVLTPVCSVPRSRVLPPPPPPLGAHFPPSALPLCLPSSQLNPSLPSSLSRRGGSAAPAGNAAAPGHHRGSVTGGQLVGSASSSRLLRGLWRGG